MFTVRHIHTNGGDALYLASEVTFMPTDAASACFTRSPIEAAHTGGMVNILRESGVLLGLCGGTVEVMNDKGTIVQRYELEQIIYDPNLPMTAYFSDTRLMGAGAEAPASPVHVNPGQSGWPEINPAHFD
jgi:hypothetical protein